MRKRIVSLLLLTVAATMVTGCGAQGKLHSKSEVLEYMESAVPQEEFTFESVEKVDDADVSTEIYHFRSKERDFEFIAKNTRSSILPDAAVYDEAIVPQYVEGVHELYIDDVESILSGSALAIDGDSISFEK